MEKHVSGSAVYKGADIGDAKRVVILLHGRGSSATGILPLSEEFEGDDICWIAPQATNNTWYPYSFLQPVEMNEPWLSSAIEMLDEILDDVRSKGITDAQIFFMGFSQGACLALEYAARRASSYKGVAAFSGGLIGAELIQKTYKPTFDGSPIFIGCSDFDFHIPEKRVHDSADLLKKLGADVNAVIYHGLGHTINTDEIKKAAAILK